MPWKTESSMEQKQRFVALAQSGHFTISELCEEYGVSRKTGYKWIGRYQELGTKGLNERSRAPKNVPARTEDKIERLIVTERRRRPTWGPKKLGRILEVKYGVESPPANSTIGEILKRNGLVKARRRRPGAFGLVASGTVRSNHRQRMQPGQATAQIPRARRPLRKRKRRPR